MPPMTISFNIGDPVYFVLAVLLIIAGGWGFITGGVCIIISTYFKERKAFQDAALSSAAERLEDYTSAQRNI